MLSPPRALLALSAALLLSPAVARAADPRSWTVGHLEELVRFYRDLHQRGTFVSRRKDRRHPGRGPAGPGPPR